MGGSAGECELESSLVQSSALLRNLAVTEL